jgi:glycosyltransferase involved in cell wall biosynthesis
VVTPFGVDTRRFCPPAIPRPPGHLNVGTVKALEDKYGIEYLVRAFAIVLEKGVHPAGYRLLIIGGGSCRDSLERLALELGIADKVQFAGTCAYADAHLWHQALDVAVYPSIDPSESFGVAAVESQSCAVPVVVSRIGGLPEVVVDGETGTTVMPRDVNALASAMLKILNDPALRQSMGEAGRRHVAATYSIEACTAIMERVYAEVVARSAGNPPIQEMPG